MDMTAPKADASSTYLASSTVVGKRKGRKENSLPKPARLPAWRPEAEDACHTECGRSKVSKGGLCLGADLHQSDHVCS